jgi:hypothetical protein
MPPVWNRPSDRCEVLLRVRPAGGHPDRDGALRVTPRLHAQAPGREDPHLQGRARRGAQAGHGPLRRCEGLDGAPRRPGPRGGPETAGSCPPADDGGGPPLRGDREPGHGRRDHGPLRRAAGPRGPRGAGVLRRDRSPARDAAPDGGPPARPRRDRRGPGGSQLRRGRGARDLERPPHGLHGRRPDHAPGRPHGVARQPGHDPPDRRHPPPGGRVRRGDATRRDARQGPAGTRGGLRAHGSGAAALAAFRRGRPGSHALRRAGRRARAGPGGACSRRACGASSTMGRFWASAARTDS